MRRLAPALALAWVLAAPAGVHTKPLGKGFDPLLAQFEALLDARGIDIVPGLARSVDFRKEHRPRLAKLAGFPVTFTAKGPAASDPEVHRRDTRLRGGLPADRRSNWGDPPSLDT
jgi:hypothetical protein